MPFSDKTSVLTLTGALRVYMRHNKSAATFASFFNQMNITTTVHNSHKSCNSMLLALHFIPVSQSVTQWVIVLNYHSFEVCKLFCDGAINLDFKVTNWSSVPRFLDSLASDWGGRGSISDEGMGGM